MNKMKRKIRVVRLVARINIDLISRLLREVFLKKNHFSTKHLIQKYGKLKTTISFLKLIKMLI